MSEGNNSAAALAASVPVKIENISIPGFGGGVSNEAFDPTKWKVRYGKFDLDELGSLTELEIIETKGLSGLDTVVLNKQSFSFMDKMFIVVTYLEKITATS